MCIALSTVRVFVRLRIVPVRVGVCSAVALAVLVLLLLALALAVCRRVSIVPTLTQSNNKDQREEGAARWLQPQPVKLRPGFNVQLPRVMVGG